MISRTLYFNSAFLLLTLVLTACGGGGGAAPVATVSQGKFIDSAVEGMTYTSGKETGLTNTEGLFSYETGKTVTFSIGDIVIGTANGSATVTPLQLFIGSTNEFNAFVTNMVRFLMTIDDDHDPSNGIQITQEIRDAAAGMSIDFRVSPTQFTSDSNVVSVVDTLTTASSLGNQGLVSVAAAQTHFGDTLLSLLVGTYSGTFAGDDRGTWNMTISANGGISGSASPSLGSSIPITGNVLTSGSMINTSGWTGGFDIATGIVSGNWTVSVNSTTFSGTYTGSKN